MATTLPAVNVVMPGFSLTNRLLLYANIITVPAAALGGLGTHLPINAGFLGYTIYQQYIFYVATKHKQLHALCMLPQYLNTLYAFTYAAGISAGNHWLSVITCLGTIAALIINNITTWTAYLTDLPEGYGVYRFYFFGWRTLSPNWRTLFLLWAVFDSFATFDYIALSVYVAGVTPVASKEVKNDDTFKWWSDTSLVWGSVVGLVMFWPVVLWTELIVKENHIVSETDMISFYLFIVQIALLAIPSVYSLLRRLRPCGGDGSTGFV
ncbi:hypothetical protein D9619_005194 [Psilocybe cf. subviscida]|uniref:Uncharacterized protein n=1 Tax=Psilocybe cf. subviscida TaxID=2480587 RepID=A0A8H5BWL9_9AGAR|nr:hypothetical protein D9619_005194 [Psilocybe cf. subviscida]